MNDIKIGDRVAWADVPDGALVSRIRGEGGVFFYQRNGASGWCVGGRQSVGDGYFGPMCNDGWTWNHIDRGPVTIVALGLTGDESADDLRRAAEVFEVRGATFTLDEFEMPADLAHSLEELAEEDDAAARDLLARRLHAAGWRPGMSAEDATRMLSRP